MAVVTRTSATVATITLTGNATAKALANSIANLTITFNNGAFTNTPNVTNVTNASNAVGTVTFADVALAYGTTTFAEAIANDGSTSTTSVITLTGDTFRSSIGNFTGGGVDYTVTNLPAGLTMNIAATSSTTALVTITGTASANLTNPADVTNLTITWTDTGILNSNANTVTNYAKNDFVFDFVDQPTVTYAGSFTESLTNDGSVTGSRIATLTGDTFVAGVAGFTTVSNVPAGLTAVTTFTDATHVTVTLTGNATAKALANSIANLTITFANGAFTNTLNTSNVANASNASGIVNFADVVLSYGTTIFVEVPANDGSTTTTSIITLTGDTFRIGVGNFTAGGVDYTVTNLPGGLTMVITATSTTTALVTITGTASANLTNPADVTNLTITWTDTGITNSNANTVTDSAKNDFVFDNIDQPSITYAGAFTESIANDGSVTGSRIATLTGDTFVAGVAGFTTVTNAPAGLTPVVTFTDSTHVTVTLTGNASPHVLATSLANLTITFNNGAFTTTPVATNVTAYTNIVGTVTFIDQPSIAYAGNFTESLTNDGSVTGSRTATLTGDTYAATLTLG